MGEDGDDESAEGDHGVLHLDGGGWRLGEGKDMFEDGDARWDRRVEEAGLGRVDG